MMMPEFVLMRSDPFTSVRRLHQEMNRLFTGVGNESAVFPVVNIWSNEDEVIVKAEIPGIDPKDMDIKVQGDQLSLQGERKPDVLSENVVCHRAERGTGQFSRSFRLPYEVDSAKVGAKYVHGVLTVTLPRAEASKPKKIAIESN